MTLVPRCSVASEARDEPLIGTASTVTRFLLLEDPGPWGVDAFRDARLPSELKNRLARRLREHGIRLLLIRRHGRSRPQRLRCFAASVSAQECWVETATLDSAQEVLDLDLAALGERRSLGLPRHAGSLFLVCTHGRHDPCCAERGRPLARALSRSHEEQTWECSHVGGDRFAGNLVVLPHGIYYGRVDADSGARLAREYERGRLDLHHLRGRVTQSFAAQAAEWYLRAALDRVGIDDVRLLSEASSGGRTEAVFSGNDGTGWVVRVRTSPAAPTRLSCAAIRLSAPPRFELIGVEPQAQRRM